MQASARSRYLPIRSRRIKGMRTQVRARLFGGAGIALAIFAATGCKNKDTAKADPALAAQAAQQAKDEEDLLARRDSLMTSKSQLKEKTEELTKQIADQHAAGADTTALEASLRELSSKQDANKDAIIELLEKQNSAYKSEVTGLRGQVGDKGVELGQVLAKLGTRDAELAAMETRIGELVKDFGGLRGDVQRQAAQCSNQAPAVAPTIIQQTVDAHGSKYSRKEIEPLLARARATMQKKGLLASDLPGTVQGFEKEATTAMGEGDFGKAFFAANQLAASVEEIRIDKPFIAAKMNRLSARFKGKTLGEAAQKQAEGALSDATAKYVDGNFAAANAKLNQIAGML